MQSNIISYRYYFILFWLIIVCPFSQTFSQVDFSKSYRLLHYTTDNGLPQNSVINIKYDKNGNMWLATQGGLVIFTGVSFIKPRQATSTPKIAYLVMDKNKKLHVCDQHSKIYKINEDAFTLEQVYTNGTIKGDAAFWQAYTQASDSAIRKHFFASYIYKSIVEATDHSQYTISGAKSFLYFDTVLHFIKKVNYLAPLFTIGDLAFILSKKNTFQCYKKDMLINASVPILATNNENRNILKSAFFFTSGKETYCIGNNNIYKVIYNNKQLIFEPIITKLPDIKYISHAERNLLTGEFAIGTQADGLYIVQKNTAFSTKKNNGIPNNGFSDIFITNSIYSHVFLPNKKTLDSYGFVYSENEEIGYRKFPYLDTRLLSNDSLGHIWYHNIFTNKLQECDSTLKILNTYTTPSSDKILLFMSAKTKDTLYFCSSSSLYRLIKSTKKPTIDLLASPGFVRNLYETELNTILILTEKGIWVYDKLTSDIRFIQGSEKIYFRSIYKLKSGGFLLGTYGQGIYFYKNNSLVPLPIDKKQKLKTAHCFLKDKEGFIWISSNLGLFQVAESDIEEYINGINTEIYYHYYDKTNGFLNNEFNGGFQNVAAISSDASLITFSSIDGIVYLNTKKNKPILPNNSLHFYNIHSDDSTYSNLSSKITLPASFKNLSIQVITSFFGNSENLIIKYRLLNYDNNWKDLDDDNIIKFNQLNPGEYILEVKKINGFGVNNYSIKKLMINIEKKWFQKWWFILCCILLLVALFFLIIHLRTNRLHKQKIKLESLIRQRNKELIRRNEKLISLNKLNEVVNSVLLHDIKGPLKLSVEVSNSLHKDWLKLDESFRLKLVKEIRDTNKEIYSFVYNLLGWIKLRNERELTKEQINVLELTNELIHTKVAARYQQKNIQLINTVPNDIDVTTNKQVLLIILNNILDNAIKYTNKGTITLNAKVSNEKVILECIDTGIGMTEEQIENLFKKNDIENNNSHEDSFKLGYTFIKELLPLINGKLNISSTKGIGTTISIIIE